MKMSLSLEINDALAEHVGEQLAEGKTKRVLAMKNDARLCLMQSKDVITAGNAARHNELVGKAAVSTDTTCRIFDYLKSAGLPVAYERRAAANSFLALRCHMIPIEWVTRRVATGSFLRRNPGIKEGYRFAPPKMETFFKDDANDDPQWSREQVMACGLAVEGRVVTEKDYDEMAKMTVLVFEMLERAWAAMDCALIDMKIEFGYSPEGKIVLADVIDSDSWRLWPKGDKRLMKDKQVYRDMPSVTADGLQSVLRNFEWISQQLADGLLPAGPRGRVLVVMGSPSDEAHCRAIERAVLQHSAGAVACQLRVCSAHKQPDAALRLAAEAEAAAAGQPLVLVAVAGRSNGLGPVLSGVATCPVINCPPLAGDFATSDAWSSLRMPSRLGCVTTLGPETAALAALQIIGQTDHVVWGRLRAGQALTWVQLRDADAALQS